MEREFWCEPKFFLGVRKKISILTEKMRVSPLQGLDTVFTVGYPGRCHWAIEFLRLWRARRLGRVALVLSGMEFCAFGAPNRIAPKA
jgi:hypothetical protein